MKLDLAWRRGIEVVPTGSSRTPDHRAPDFQSIGLGPETSLRQRPNKKPTSIPSNLHVPNLSQHLSTAVRSQPIRKTASVELHPKMASLVRTIRPAARRTLLTRTFATTTCRRQDVPQSELGVGELQGAKFKIEPLRRTGEDGNTKRARLLCMSPRIVSPLTITNIGKHTSCV